MVLSSNSLDSDSLDAPPEHPDDGLVAEDGDHGGDEEEGEQLVEGHRPACTVWTLSSQTMLNTDPSPFHGSLSLLVSSEHLNTSTDTEWLASV